MPSAKPHTISIRTLAVVAALSTGAAFADTTTIAVYDASGGRLPDEGCWLSTGLHFGSPPVVQHGSLHLGPTSHHAASFYSRWTEPFSFADGASVEATTLIVVSDFLEDGPFAWTGFAIGLHDSAGGFARLGIAGDRILLQTSEDGYGDQTHAMDTTTAFHTYRLEIDGPVVTAFVDGEAVLKAVTGTGHVTNAVLFGDVGLFCASETITASVRAEANVGSLAADLDRDGLVGAADMATLLGHWGTSECGADLSGDGIVDITDLSMLLGSWTPQ